MDLDYRSEHKNNDEVIRLIEAWVSERCCPDILYYEQQLVQDIQEIVQHQQKLIARNREKRKREASRKRPRYSSRSEGEEFSSSSSASFTDTEMSGRDEGEEDFAEQSEFACLMLEVEVDRILFYLRSYLRCRIQKIQQYALFVRKDPTARQKLSRAEGEFAQKIVQAEESLRYDLFTKHIPEQYRTINYWPREGHAQPEEEEVQQGASGVNEVARPNPESYVFVRILQDLGPRNIGGEQEDTILSKHEIVVGKYSGFEDMINNFEAELI